jgi:hypothetical protein
MLEEKPIQITVNGELRDGRRVTIIPTREFQQVLDLMPKPSDFDLDRVGRSQRLSDFVDCLKLMVQSQEALEKVPPVDVTMEELAQIRNLINENRESDEKELTEAVEKHFQGEKSKKVWRLVWGFILFNFDAGNHIRSLKKSIYYLDYYQKRNDSAKVVSSQLASALEGVL